MALWACANIDCGGRSQTPLDDQDWPFGKIFLGRRERCDSCRSPVYELVQCGECGAEYLSCEEVFDEEGEWLKPRLYTRDEDEFQQELESLDAEDIGDEEPTAEEPAPQATPPPAGGVQCRSVQSGWVTV